MGALDGRVSARAFDSYSGRLDIIKSANASFFLGGANDGKVTTYLTSGIIIGRIPLTHPQGDRPGRLGLTFGTGEQIAVTHFHRTNHNVVITVRMPF